jgi:hypothetical protein
MQEDVASIDAVISAVYDVISGPASAERDWHRAPTIQSPKNTCLTDRG